MKILVTNDDGINADGLWSLVSALKEVGKVTVVAPDREQSGVGTSMSLHHPVRLAKIHEKIAGIDTYSVEGTPADCVLLAMKVIMPGGIDLVASGINQGPNCSYDVFLSGTVGAALQGFFYDIPSIAVSMRFLRGPQVRDGGADCTGSLLEYVKRKKMKGKMLLNVNVPSLPLKQIRGIDVTRLGEKKYSAGVEKGYDGRHTYYWILHRSTDTAASRDGFMGAGA